MVFFIPIEKSIHSTVRNTALLHLLIFDDVEQVQMLKRSASTLNKQKLKRKNKNTKIEKKNEVNNRQNAQKDHERSYQSQHFDVSRLGYG